MYINHIIVYYNNTPNKLMPSQSKREKAHLTGITKEQTPTTAKLLFFRTRYTRYYKHELVYYSYIMYILYVWVNMYVICASKHEQRIGAFGLHLHLHRRATDIIVPSSAPKIIWLHMIVEHLLTRLKNKQKTCFLKIIFVRTIIIIIYFKTLSLLLYLS